jgi:hypothetical protein
MNCGFTHSDELFMLNDDADAMQNGYPYCPKCGTIMDGFQPDSKLTNCPWDKIVKTDYTEIQNIEPEEMPAFLNEIANTYFTHDSVIKFKLTQCSAYIHGANTILNK